MRCEQIREQLVETARGRELSSDLRKIVFAHAADCAECGQRLEQEQRLTAGLAQLALSGESAPVRLGQSILRELRVVPIRRARWKVWAFPSAAAVAALVLLAFVFHAPEPQPVVSSTASASFASTEPELDNFVPLPYAPELGLDEQAEMIRVQMPREALRAMGVPVSGETGDDQIEADVLLGRDGTARAIRISN